jgi:diacylglycerol O-acyltransferase
MHIGAVLLLDAGPLSLRNGGIDIERLRAYTDLRLRAVPRARATRAALGPAALPVFPRAAEFELGYHVRHACLPKPGDERALRSLAARVFSQPLDPTQPLWELWFVEGLDDERCALIARCDSALLASDAGSDLLGALLAREPDAGAESSWVSETVNLVRGAFALLRPATYGALVGRGASAALDALERGVGLTRPALAGAGGAHRRVDWLALESADLHAVSEQLGGTSHDVLLASLAGGLRRLLAKRALTAPRDLLALTALGVGPGEVATRLRLPVGESDPRTRLVRVRSANERRGAPEMPSAEPWPSLRPLARAAAACARGRRAELSLSVLPPATADAELCGARVRAAIPLAPLAPGHALAVTAAQLGDRVALGFCADAARVPDLSLLVDAVAAAFDELRRLALTTTAPVRARARARRRAKTTATHAELGAP